LALTGSMSKTYAIGPCDSRSACGCRSCARFTSCPRTASDAGWFCRPWIVPH
jgi:hypothetical protein